MDASPSDSAAAVADGPVAVLGPGGVGGFLAAALTRAGARVVVVARGPTADAIAADGLRVESVRLGDFVARPAVATRLEEPVGTLLVATKAAGLEAALERVAATPALVVPLLNGLDHVALLRARFGSRAVVGTIRVEADRSAPGRITQTSPFLRVDIASDDPERLPALEALATRLKGAEVPTRLVASEAECLWSKLVRLNTLACMTTAHDLPLGAIRDDATLRAELERCIAETAAVARAEGAAIDPAGVLAELEQAHPGLGSSMRRDVAAGREPELDAIPGAVLRAGARHGLACPTVAALAQAIAVRAGVPAPVV